VTDGELMARAIALAWRGWGRVAPNPLVGAVLARDGQIIGEGWHEDFGGRHAEIAALARTDGARGSTCAVTLEPCAHTGKTPPCAGALIDAGVARVLIAVEDPHRAAHGGVERLREAGIDVSVGVGAEAATAMNAGYLWSHVRPSRPFVALKLATSIDGLIADAAGDSHWVSETEARDFVHWLRAGFDGIGVGRGTAETDDPALTVRGALEPRVSPTRVLFAGAGDLRRDLRLFEQTGDTPTIVVAAPHLADRLRRELAYRAVRVLAADTLAEALRRLREAGLRTLLVEGGGRLAGALLEDHLVDRLYWIQAPIWLGQGVGAFGERGSVALAHADAWAVVERRPLGRDTLLVVDRAPCLPAS